MKKKLLLSLLAFVFAFSCFAFSGCGKAPNQYSVSVKASHYNLGSVEGGNASYIEGEKIKIKATPATTTSSNQSPAFICWLMNNKVISTKAEYEFEVTAETAGEYVALFTCEFLEYFALDQIIVDTGITEDIKANVVKMSLELGSIENLTQPVFSIEPSASERVISLTKTNIYAMGENPFAFDIQENIFVKFIIEYEQDEVRFTSITTAQLPLVLDVTVPVVVLPTTSLSPLSNAENPDITMNIKSTPSVTLFFSRLTTFELVEPEVEEEAK